MSKFQIKKITSVFIFFILYLLQQTFTLDFDLNATEIISSKDQYRIRLKPQKGYPPYKITYPDLPPNWVGTQQYLFAPKKTTDVYNQYLISVVLQDRSKNKYDTDLLFTFNSQRMLVKQTQDVISPPETENLTNVFENITNLGTFKQLLDYKIKDIIRNASRLRAPTKNLDSYFQQIIVQSEVKRLINENDIASLIKVVSLIPTSNLNCVQQIVYLSDIAALGYQSLYAKQKGWQDLHYAYLRKIQAAQNYNIRKLQLVDNSLEINHDFSLQIVTKQLVGNLEEELGKKKAEYMSTIQQLKNTYIQYYIISNMVTKSKEIDRQTNIQITFLKKQIDDKSKRIQNITTNMPNLSEDDKMKKTQQRKFLQQNIKKLQESLQSYEDYSKNQEQIISNVVKELDKRKISIKSVQITIQRLKQEISDINLSLLNLDDPLLSYDSQLLTYVIKSNPLVNVRSASEKNALLLSWAQISSLNDTISYLNKLIDTIYYKCYGVKNLQASDKIGVYVYQLSYDDFMKYLIGFYQFGNSFSFVMQKKAQKVQLQRVNVLSTIWTQRFGDSIDSEEIKTNKAGKATYPSCLTPNGLRGNVGLINEIKRNVIQVRVEKGELKYILLGACSRIELVQKNPKSGNMIFWKGKQISPGLFDGYFVLIA